MFRSKKEKPQPERDSDNRPVLTPPFLKRLCDHQGLFETPKLNNELFLHFLGLRDIRNLDDYVNLKALWLENNLITKIENLSHLTQLRCLFLQNNKLTKIENLQALKSLAILNLSHNQITKIDNLEGLTSLEDLDVSNNKITASESIKGLNQAPSIVSLDLSNNQIEDADYIIETLKDRPKLRCLYLRGNRCIRLIPNYRKQMIASVISLRYLDDRPVSDVERLGAEAWKTHGKDAEMEVRRKHFEEKQQKDWEQFKEFGELVDKAEQRKQRIRNRILVQREEERTRIHSARNRLLTSQDPRAPEWLKKLDEKEKELDKPIEDSELMDTAKCRVEYISGELNKYGEVVEPKPKKKLEEIPIETIEKYLVEYNFDFEIVSDYFYEEYESSPDAVRELWFQHYQATYHNYLDDLD